MPEPDLPGPCPGMKGQGCIMAHRRLIVHSATPPWRSLRLTVSTRAGGVANGGRTQAPR